MSLEAAIEAARVAAEENAVKADETLVEGLAYAKLVGQIDDVISELRVIQSSIQDFV